VNGGCVECDDYLSGGLNDVVSVDVEDVENDVVVSVNE
jgi:hypothetical protein